MELAFRFEQYARAAGRLLVLPTPNPEVLSEQIGWQAEGAARLLILDLVESDTGHHDPRAMSGAVLNSDVSESDVSILVSPSRPGCLRGAP